MRGGPTWLASTLYRKKDKVSPAGQVVSFVARKACVGRGAPRIGRKCSARPATQ